MRKYIFVFALVAACTPQIGGSVLIDGKQFNIKSCRSGQASGFSGVDLVGEDGNNKLRLIYDPTGQARAVLFAGESVGAELGLCGQLHIEQQSSRINKIYNIKGNATLNCSANGRSVGGQVTFENCH